MLLQSLYGISDLLGLGESVSADKRIIIAPVEEVVNKKSLADTPSAIYDDKLRVVGLHTTLEFFHLTLTSDLRMKINRLIF